MNIDKKQIFLIVGVFLFSFLIIYFLFFRKSLNSDIKIENQVLNVNTGTTINSVTSKLPDNFENKLKEEGKVKEIDLSFNKEGFFDKSNTRLSLRSNIKINIDAGNTGLPDGTFLNIDIPGAEFKSTISIPGRYRYSIFFKKSGEQSINIYGDGLPQGISKIVTVR